MKWIKIKVLMSIILLLPRIDAFSTGAPIEACVDMIPQHPPSSPQPLSPPIEVIAPAFIESGSTIQIIIRGAEGFQFRGFFIQARNTVDNMPIGRFIPNPQVNTVNCFIMTQSAATHSNNGLKNEVVFDWEAPEITANAVVFEF